MTDPSTHRDLVLTPGTGIDPMGALTSSMHASPRLYAILVGSGMSRSAGQLGAWEILDQLIKSYAAAEGLDLESDGLSPTDWWEQTIGESVDYSQVLEQLEPTRGGRQKRLATYFEVASPSSAHQSLAKLCASGKVQVILTTNFDRLIEQALDEHDVHHQVVNERSVTGMQPLVHRLVTVIKVNGDYLSLGMRNTSLELAKYTRWLDRTLREVLRDFGLIVVGWSGQWDIALRRLLQANSSRNYPMYWVAHQGEVCEEAQRLIDNRGAYQIDSNGADEFFADLVSHLDRLDQLARQRTTKRQALRHGGLYAPHQRNAMPNLESRNIWIRTAVTLGPTNVDETGYIDPDERGKVLTALNEAKITLDLINLSMMGGVSAGVPRQSWLNSPIWEIASEDHLTRDTVGFRFQPPGDRCELTARQWLQTPAFDGAGDNLLAIFDIGVGKLADPQGSVRKLSLEELTQLLLDQFVAQSTNLSETLNHLTPNIARLRGVEFHLFVPPNTDKGSDKKVDDYVDLSSLGFDGRKSSYMSAAFPVSEPLTPKDQFELVIEAIRHIALSIGYTQPDRGIATLTKTFAHKFDLT